MANGASRVNMYLITVPKGEERENETGAVYK